MTGNRNGDWALLALTVLVWGAAWPTIKAGLAAGFPPLWFAALRFVIGAACLFAAVAALGRVPPLPRGRDAGLVLLLACTQLAAFSALTGLALTLLPAGRAAVLAYTTPIWVAPLAALAMRRYPGWGTISACALGVAGAAVVASPALSTGDVSASIAYALLLAAALAWAVAIVAIRLHPSTTPALDLAPWQMLLASVLLAPLALAFEGLPPPPPAATWWSLAYVGPVATAFAWWAAQTLGRRMAPEVLSVSWLATPIVGIGVSVVWLGEAMDFGLIGGGLLIAMAIVVALRGTR